MENNQNIELTEQQIAEREANEVKARREKIMAMKENGLIAYKDKFDRTHTIAEARQLNDGDKCRVCGRVIGRRGFGKLMFLDLYDVYGKIQLELTLNNLGEEKFTEIKKYLDQGDFVGVDGEICHTKVGELTVRAFDFVILTKALRPLPEKFHGVKDDDIRYRQRYLDCISNESTRETLKTRLKAIKFIRDFMDSHGFVEVETPILQGVASGAAAKPFITKHNALNKDFYLRIAPELALKEIIACGFDRVYEIGKNFRNEGMDPSHLQEFTVIEWYAAYWNCEDNIKFSTDLFQGLVQHIKGSLKFEYQGVELDFGNIRHINYCEELSKLIGSNILDFTDMENLKSVIKSKHLVDENELESAKSLPATIDLLFKKALRHSLIQPCIVYNYPACLVPLARRNDKDPRVIDMFQFVVNGWEMDKAYSELVDPITQREAFEEQARNRANGDEESFGVDEDFLLAMEHGMPPISGLGIGIDRLIALLTNQETLRDVIFFPMVK
ncbi:MAG: lysine--tRNA ligase [Clostridia bacterium]|nr:lysine--tRNA ligase [Clostridia bacterium]